MPKNELDQIQAVNRFLTLQINKEEELNEIMKLAAEICGTQTALITLHGKDLQYIIFRFGSDLETSPKHDSFCIHVSEQRDVLIVPDAQLDERFAGHPFVSGDPHIRFYAGAPLITRDGHHLGCLCVIDQTPKQLSNVQQQMLQALSKHVIQLLEFDTSLQILKEQYVEAKNSETKLRSFFESSSSYHLLMDKELRVVAFNKAFSEFIQRIYGRALTTGMGATDYMHEKYLEEFIECCAQALSGVAVQAERHMEFECEAMSLQVTYDPARNPDGEIIGISYNATDITKRVEQEKMVLLQNESLKKIAFIQSHNLRRPVSSIIGLMNILKLEGHTSTIKELQLMEEAVEELDKQIRLIVNYS